MIQDVYLRNFTTGGLGSNDASQGSPNTTTFTASLLVWLPRSSTVSAQITPSLTNLKYWGYGKSANFIAPWEGEWDTSAGIKRYGTAGGSTFPQPPATSIENVPNCDFVQFVLVAQVCPDSVGLAEASIDALATATIFLKS
jgi:hypothetical protein